MYPDWQPTRSGWIVLPQLRRGSRCPLRAARSEQSSRGSRPTPTRELRQAAKAPSSRPTGFARATSFAPRYPNHLNALGLGANGANAMRLNPLLIQANARTPTQFTHVFAVRHLQHKCDAAQTLVGFHQLDAIAKWIIDVDTMVAIE